jgi:hypothetical protein
MGIKRDINKQIFLGFNGLETTSKVSFSDKMRSYFRRLILWTHGKVSRQMAIEIARKDLTYTPDPANLKIYDKEPDNCHVYGVPDDDSCRFIYAPCGDRLAMLRSSRVVVVSKKNW